MFCQRLARLQPTRILDIGCATGLWLEELDKVLPRNCEFIGLDSDESALARAADRSRDWSRQVSFQLADVDCAEPAVPEADLTLLFNLSSYLAKLDNLLLLLAKRPGHVAVRQYDGAALRFGPMATEDRAMIEQSLRVSVGASSQFRYYDLDRTYAAIHAAPFATRDVSFEPFARTNPFPSVFVPYYSGTLDWMADYLSDAARERLLAWRSARETDPTLPAYFIEFDLAAVLS